MPRRARRSPESPRCWPQPPAGSASGDARRSFAAVHVLGNSLAVIDPTSNRVERQIPVGARPAFVDLRRSGALGGEPRRQLRSRGSIRAHAGSCGRSRRMHPPAGLAFGAGSVWVANSDAATVSRIDPQYNRAVQTIPFADRVRVPRRPRRSRRCRRRLGRQLRRGRSRGSIRRSGKVVATIVVGGEPRAIAVGRGRGLGRQRLVMARSPGSIRSN